MHASMQPIRLLQSCSCKPSNSYMHTQVWHLPSHVACSATVLWILTIGPYDCRNKYIKFNAPKSS